jgi:hypothetical protein
MEIPRRPTYIQNSWEGSWILLLASPVQVFKNPLRTWTLTQDGSLPSKTSMGADEMSRYFPFSRTPGDMDVIPDPYRVAQAFSPSSYSSKTEPVPFLTDFSAFQK